MAIKYDAIENTGNTTKDNHYGSIQLYHLCTHEDAVLYTRQKIDIVRVMMLYIQIACVASEYDFLFENQPPANIYNDGLT